MPYSPRKFSMLSRQPENDGFDDISMAEGVSAEELKRLVNKQKQKRDKIEEAYE
jgi:hypothetical protein